MVIIYLWITVYFDFNGERVTVYICRFKRLKKWNQHQEELKQKDHFIMCVFYMYMVISKIKLLFKTMLSLNVFILVFPA